MPRTSLTALRALGALGSLYTANAADLTMTAADPSNKNQTPHTGKVLLLAHNPDAEFDFVVTITSAVDNSNGRTGDVTYTLGPGEYAVLGPFDLDGWVQVDGKLYCEGDVASGLLGMVDLSNS